jgi:leader peptidase (prepilin peptidase)/N-methyltransferase
MITGLLAIDPWDAFSGLVMTGLPYFLRGNPDTQG